MKRLGLSLLPLLTFAGVLFHSTEAKAVGPVGVELGAKLGYATNPNGDQPNPLGVGAGVRGGLELFHKLYVGGNVMYYFGSTEDTPLGATSSNTSVSTHTLLLGLDVGYSLKISELTIRPQLGFGDASITSLEPFAGTVNNPATNVANFSVTKQRLYLEPGIVALVQLGPIFVGADVNLLVIPDGELDNGNAFASFAFGGQAGLKF